jgi:hypothetical protein
MSIEDDEDDDDAPSMQEAYDRARERGGADTFGVVADLEEHPVELPEMDFTKPEPTAKHPLAAGFEKAALGRSPSAYEQPDEPEAEPDSYAPYTPSSPAAAKPADDRAAKYQSALGDVSRIAAEKVPGIDTDALEAAQRDRRAKTANNDFTRAIQAWMFRKPFEPTAPTDDSDLATVHGIKAKQAQGDKAQRLSAAEMVAKALRGEKQPGGSAMSAYQLEEVRRNAVLDDQRRRTKEADDKRHDTEHTETVADRRLSHADSVAQQQATLKLAEAQFAALEREREDSAAQKLGGALGEKTDFDTQYARLMELADANGGDLPGLGVGEGIRQKPGVVGTIAQAVSPSTPEAVESRKLLRQLAQGYAHKISGAGVSNQERAQLEAATVDVDNGDPKIAMAGLQTLKHMWDAKTAVTKAGFRPGVVKRVEGATPAPAQNQNASPPAGTIPTTATDVHQLKSGKWVWTLPGGAFDSWSPQ